MSDDDLPKPDLLLRGKRVRRRYAKRISPHGKPITPIVTLAVREGDHFDHPEISVRWGSRYGRGDVELVFQCNRIGVRDAFGEIATGHSRSRGFLSLGYTRSAAYAGDIKASIESSRELALTLALIADAKKAFHLRWIRQPDGVYPSYRPQHVKLCADDDEVLAIVIGLQQLGIDLRIFNRHLRQQRERRIEGREHERRMAPVRAQEEAMRLTIRASECTGPYPDAPDYGGECGATHGTCPKHARTLAVAS